MMGFWQPRIRDNLPRIVRLVAATNAIFSSRCRSFAYGRDGSNNNYNRESLDIRQKNKALNHLIHSGRLRDARAMFDGLTCRSIVTWNSMISGCVRRGELTNARNLFDSMPERDVVSWNSMLLGYALSRNAREVEEGRRLFDRMPERDPVSWNTMIRGYARNRRMGDALVLFERMPGRNAVSWNTMITGFLENGDVGKAVEMFETMPVRDQTSMSAIISGLIQNGRLEDAESVLDRRWKIGDMEGFVDACNNLIAGYGREGRVKEARRLFNLIPDEAYQFGGKDESFERIPENGGVSKNIVTWNSMMMCYVKAGDMFSARKLFDGMPKWDQISWNTMISGYVHALDIREAESLFQQMYCPDDRTWNSMIAGFSQKGELEEAQNYFDRMPFKNLVSWNTLIAGYDQNGDYEVAIKFFSKMLFAGERPDRHTLSSVLSACAGLASFNLGVQIHQLITKTFLWDVPLNNSLITMYARCGNLVDARSVFESMTRQRDFISWNAMIGGYAQHGLAGQALDLFKEMKKTRVSPTNITFISVLNACCHAGLVAEGQRQFESMVKDYGMIPSVKHYALLVNLVGRNGQLEDAMRIIESMLVPPDKSVWGALLQACKVHSNWGLAGIAADAVMEVDPDSAGPYVLLYNMYADKGRWEDATKAREVLDRSGIRKQPGYSWIELNKIVHIFVAGDRSHSQAPEIYDLIDTYDRIARDEYFAGTLAALGMQL